MHLNIQTLKIYGNTLIVCFIKLFVQKLLSFQVKLHPAKLFGAIFVESVATLKRIYCHVIVLIQRSIAQRQNGILTWSASLYVLLLHLRLATGKSVVTISCATGRIWKNNSSGLLARDRAALLSVKKI